MAVLIVLTWPWGAKVLVPALVLPLAAILLVPAVTVRPDGISLYWVNHLQWKDVASVRAARVVGLPYAVVQRHKGIRWWIPLYVDDRQGFLTTLASRAPAGSALHAFATAAAQ